MECAFTNHSIYCVIQTVLVMLNSSDVSRIVDVAVAIFLLLCADGIRSLPTCLRGMSWWRTPHWRPLLYAEEVAGSHTWVLFSHLLCLVADTSGHFDASPSVTISEVKASPTVFTQLR